MWHIRFRYLKAVLWLLSGLALAMAETAAAYYAEDFTQAKKMARMIWSEQRETFYCGCPYDKQGIIDYKQCAYVPADKRQSKRISWEHVLPVSWYGKTLPCWKSQACQSKNGKSIKGRECCRKTAAEFRKMEADLHNLVPAIRETNMKRRDYHYAEWAPHAPSDCYFYVDDIGQRVEPRDEVKGMAARITLYMAKKYNIPLEQSETQLLIKWNKRFPPSDWEQRWHQQVSVLQGDVNPFIQRYNSEVTK